MNRMLLKLLLFSLLVVPFSVFIPNVSEVISSTVNDRIIGEEQDGYTEIILSAQRQIKILPNITNEDHKPKGDFLSLVVKNGTNFAANIFLNDDFLATIDENSDSFIFNVPNGEYEVFAEALDEDLTWGPRTITGKKMFLGVTLENENANGPIVVSNDGAITSKVDNIIIDDELTEYRKVILSAQRQVEVMQDITSKDQIQPSDFIKISVKNKTNFAVNFFIDGDFVFTVNANSMTRLQVPNGEYEIFAETFDEDLSWGPRVISGIGAKFELFLENDNTNGSPIDNDEFNLTTKFILNNLSMSDVNVFSSDVFFASIKKHRNYNSLIPNGDYEIFVKSIDGEMTWGPHRFSSKGGTIIMSIAKIGRNR